MTPAAQLGAGQVPDLVVAVFLRVLPALARNPFAVEGITVGPEPDGNYLAWNSVLLETHVRQEEAVQDVAALEVDARVGARPGVDLVDGMEVRGVAGAVVTP